MLLTVRNANSNGQNRFRILHCIRIRHECHHVACRVTKCRITRHNHRVLCLQKHIEATGVYSCAASTSLYSDTESRKQVDLNLDSTFHHPLSLSTDATISCQYIPAHLGRTAASPGSLYRHRADEKIAKHAAGCAQRLRALLPFVADIGGGIGDDPFWHWLISVYHAYERRLRANGGDGSEAAYALENLLRELQATLMRDNHTAITRLIEDR